MTRKKDSHRYIGFVFVLAFTVLTVGCGVGPYTSFDAFALPLDMTDPRYKFDRKTNTYSFQMHHEPAAVYRTLLTIIKNPLKRPERNQWVEKGKRVIVARYDDELRVELAYPPARDSYFQMYPGGVVTIICVPAAKGTKLVAKFKPK